MKRKMSAILLVVVIIFVSTVCGCSQGKGESQDSNQEKKEISVPESNVTVESKGSTQSKLTENKTSDGTDDKGDNPKKKMGGTFVTSGYYDPPPAFHGNAYAPSGVGRAGNVADFMFERLFEFAPLPDTTYIPHLGESYELNGKELKVSLKKGVKWSDGTPFTSKDVECTLYMGFLAGSPIWKYVDKIEIPDDYTVVVIWRNASPILTTMLFNEWIRAPYHIYGKWSDQLKPLTNMRDEKGNMTEEAQTEVEKIREDLYTFKPDYRDTVVTGPYIIENVTASEVILKKNKEYREPDKISFDNIKIQRYTSMEAWLTTVMQYGYDAEPHGATPDVFAQIEKNIKDLRIMWIPEFSQPAYEFNTSKYPVDTPEVRKAISYIIDRKALLPIAEPGTFEPDMTSCGLIPSLKQSYMNEEMEQKLESYDHNPQKAEEILKGLGWTKKNGKWIDDKGKVVKIEVASMNSWPIYFITGDAITNMLKEFGFEAEFKAMELSAYWEYIDAGEHMIAADFRANAQTYVHPWEAYRNLYIDGAYRLGFKDPTESTDAIAEVKITLDDGTVIIPNDLIDELFYATDKEKEKEITRKLMLATNQFCPFLPIGEKMAPWKLYNPKLAGYPEPDENGLATHPLWFGGAGMRPIEKLIKAGKLYYTE